MILISYMNAVNVYFFLRGGNFVCFIPQYGSTIPVVRLPETTKNRIRTSTSLTLLVRSDKCKKHKNQCVVYEIE